MGKLKLAIAVLDCGSTGVRMLVGRMMESGKPKLIAKAECAYKAKGDLKTNMNRSICTVLDTILEKTGIEVKSCYVNISNDGVRMCGSTGEIAIIPRDTITCQNVGALLNEASAVVSTDDETLIDVVPVAFYADGKMLTEKPEGNICSTFSVDANAVIAKNESMQLICEVLSDLQIEVDGFIPEFLATEKIFDSTAFKSVKTRDCFTAIANVGGDNTEISVYYNGIPFAFGTIDMGGNTITNDIAIVLDIDKNQATRLKRDFPYASENVITNDTETEIETEKGEKTTVAASYIAAIMNARIVEIAEKTEEKVKALMSEAGCPTQNITKLFFIGDGIVNFKDIEEVLRSEIQDTDVSALDKGKDFGIKNSFSTATGMVLYIASRLKYGRRSSLVVNLNENETAKNQQETAEDKGLWNSIKTTVVEFFKKIWDKIKSAFEKLAS